MIGVFLLTGKTGVKDDPDSVGWEIIQDPNGGTSNYVERRVLDTSVNQTLRWTLLAPSEESTQSFGLRVHHGGVPQRAMSADLTLDMIAVAENIPEGAPIIDQHTPAKSILIGQETRIQLISNLSDRATLVWWLENGGGIQRTEMKRSEGGEWNANIPAMLREGTLGYRFDMENELLSMQSASFQADIARPPLQTSISGIVLHSVAIGALCCSLGIITVRIVANDREEFG